MFQRRKLIKNKPVTLQMYALSDRSLIHKPFMGYRLWPLCDRMYVRNTIKTLWGWRTLSKVAEPFVNLKKKIILKFLNVSLTVTHFKLQLFDISTFLLYEFDESDISACNYIHIQTIPCLPRYSACPPLWASTKDSESQGVRYSQSTWREACASIVQLNI